MNGNGANWKVGCSAALGCFILLVTISCSKSRNFVEKSDWKSLSRMMHEQSEGWAEREDERSVRRAGELLIQMGVDSISTNDLSELRNTYHETYVEPLLDDAITLSIEETIEQKIAGIIQIDVNGKLYRPIATYVITTFDPGTYQAHLENTYADDSIFVPEFPETYKNRSVPYSSGEAVRFHINAQFSYVVQPRYYLGQSWKPVSLELDKSGSARVPDDLYETVVFAIIADRAISKREYKVMWVLDYQGQVKQN